MRTTLTLDDDVAKLLEEEQRRTRQSFREVVNRLLREGLARAGHRRDSRPFRTEARSFGFKPGIDLDKVNQLADDMEAEAFRDGHLAAGGPARPQTPRPRS